jgi:hypothetical protein
METKNKKKGFWAAIWESMNKTGGCCGSGESCCGPAKEEDKKTTEKKAQEKSDN